MKYWALLVIPCALSGCATGTGIVPVGPDTYSVSEMRAPALGGGNEAERAVLAESNAFCAAQGRVFTPLAMHPDGDPFTPYYPTAYDATFQCLPQEGTAQPQPPKP